MNKQDKRIICVAVAILAITMITSFVRASCVEYTTMEVVVQEGDTLWGIWEKAGHGRFDDWVIKVKKMNDKELSVLMPYDRITVPVIIEN